MEITANQYSNSYTNYNGYSAYLNKDHLYSNMKQNNQISVEHEKQNQELELEKVVEHQELTKEQTVAVYFNYQNNQAMKQRMEIMIEAQEEQEEPTLSYKEIQELQEQKNRNELLEQYASSPKQDSEVSIRV